MTKTEEVQKFLEEVLAPLMEKSTTPGLDQVEVSINSINEEKGIVKLKLSLGVGLGCSPFCGCAARQLADAIERLMIEKLSWVTRVVGMASAPGKENIL